jgi:RND family efflux transporter MFP subunit
MMERTSIGVLHLGARTARGASFLLAGLLVLTACGGSPAPDSKSVPAAKVQNAAKETDLATITLSEQAESRLGLQTAAIERKAVHRTRTFGGEVVVPPGRQIVVAAPVAGRLAAASSAGLPMAGAILARGDLVFKLYPLPPGQDLIRTREEVAQAEIRSQTAQQRAKRAEQLLKDRAGSVRANEEAQAELASATQSLQATRGRLSLLEKGTSDTEPEGVTPLLVAAPQSGVLSELHARPGQTVPVGAPLFAMVNSETVWIRVPVYVGELGGLDRSRPGAVTGLADSAGSPERMAKPVAAPPSADANAASVDLFYELANSDAALRPGQKVSVTLALKESENALVVPWAAILHDVYGGTWVYVNTAPHVFVRQRVEVRHVLGGQAILARGPAPGTKVVTSGAAELFGTEFATGK